jgi:hypothetical protein
MQQQQFSWTIDNHTLLVVDILERSIEALWGIWSNLKQFWVFWSAESTE